MKAAFGILALYLTIPLAIVVAQSFAAHQAINQQASVAAAAVPGVPR